MLALYPLALVALLISSGAPTRAGSLPSLIVFARLYAWHGHWVPVDWKDTVDSEPLRVAVQVSTPYRSATEISVQVALQHVSWQGFHRVIQPADVRVPLRQTMRRGHMARFEAVLHVPVTHPLQFSRVVIAVNQGARADTVVSGLTFEPPATPAEAQVTLTVPEVFAFCAARSRVPYLGYGLAVRGYIRPVPTGGDGPALFLILNHRQTAASNPIVLATRREGFQARGFVSPPANTPVVVAGDLACRPRIGFDILGVSR